MFFDISFDLKMILAILASVVIVSGGYLPYIRDMFRGITKPHAYTWLIWSITYGTATAAMWFGRGGWGFLAMFVSCFFVVLIFFLSIKYGTRNITIGDTIILGLALLAIVVWWQMNNPLLAVLMVSAIDVVGYFPSFRKVFHEPWSETIASWAIFSIANLLNIFALSEYNLLTVTYLLAITVANIILLVIGSLRRKVVMKPA
jgi:hypothetical protein